MERRGYDIAELRDASAEVARLAEQADLFARDEERALEDVQMPTAGDALDVGCGPGFVAERMQRARPALRVVGCDVDPVMVQLASARIEARVADITALPFADASFDVAYARLVLRHLARPEAAVAEMRRVVRPGGRVVVLDGDDETMLVHPRPDHFYAALRARHAGIRARGADPSIGRRLAGLLRGGGLEDIRAAPFYVHSGHGGAEAFARILAPWLDAIDPALLAPSDVDAARKDLERWAGLTDAFAMMALVVVSGRRT